jgi:hypothetical protein
MTEPSEETSPQGEVHVDHPGEAALTAEQLKLLWHGTPQGIWVARARKLFFIPVIAAGIYLQATFWWDLADAAWKKFLFELIGACCWFVVCALAVGLFDAIYADPKFNNYQIQLQREQLLAEYQTDLNASLELRDLWVLNQKRLDLYHQIATNQAKNSFRNAQLAAGIGFLILVGSAAFVWFSNSKVTAITNGAIGVFGGALGAYIGGTFMKAQHGAAEQLRQYFDHPLELSKILIAERLIENLPVDQRSDSVQRLTQTIVTGRPPESTS